MNQTFDCAWLLLFLFMPLIAGASTNKVAQLPPSERPTTWATSLEKPGLPNLFQVSPTLFRGAQPSHEGLLELQKLGVKTIINLRGFHDDEILPKHAAMSDITIRFYTWHPEEEDMVRFLKIVTDPAKQPVFVHCKRGIDRTGTMVALYRIGVQGWPKDEAVREMTHGGFGYDGIFTNLVEYVNKLDVERIKQEAGIGLPK